MCVFSQWEAAGIYILAAPSFTKIICLESGIVFLENVNTLSISLLDR